VVDLRTYALSAESSQSSARTPTTDLGIMSRARNTIAGWMTPPVLVPLTAAAAIAAYGFYLRLY
jgi:hypothetical protein